MADELRRPDLFKKKNTETISVPEIFQVGADFQPFHRKFSLHFFRRVMPAVSETDKGVFPWVLSTACN